MTINRLTSFNYIYMQFYDCIALNGATICAFCRILRGYLFYSHVRGLLTIRCNVNLVLYCYGVVL